MTGSTTRPPSGSRGTFPGPAAGPSAVVVSVGVHALVLGTLAWTFGLRPTPADAADRRTQREVTLVATAPAPEPFAPDLEPEPLVLDPTPSAADARPEVDPFEQDTEPVEDTPIDDAAEPILPPLAGVPPNLNQPTLPTPAQDVETQEVETQDPVPSEIPPVEVESPVIETVPELVPAAEAPTASAPAELAGECPDPKYPALAAREKWQGTVVVTIDVRSDGTVSDVRLVHKSGHRILDDEVLDTVRKWRFAPSMLGGVPAKSEVRKRFIFDPKGVRSDAGDA